MKNILKVCLIVALALGGFVPARASAATQPVQEEQKSTKVKSLPFHGTLAAVDAKNRTIKVGERTFQITPETKILKDSKTAVLSDGVVGEKIGGAYLKEANGQLTAVSIRFGDKPAKESTPKKTKKTDEAK